MAIEAGRSLSDRGRSAGANAVREALARGCCEHGRVRGFAADRSRPSQSASTWNENATPTNAGGANDSGPTDDSPTRESQPNTGDPNGNGGNPDGGNPNGGNPNANCNPDANRR